MTNPHQRLLDICANPSTDTPVQNHGAHPPQKRYLRKIILFAVGAAIIHSLPITDMASTAYQAIHPHSPIMTTRDTGSLHTSSIHPVSAVPKITALVFPPKTPSVFEKVTEHMTTEETAQLLHANGMYFESLAVLVEGKPKGTAFLDPAVDPTLGTLVDVGYGYCITRKMFDNGIDAYRAQQTLSGKEPTEKHLLISQAQRDPHFLKQLNALGTPSVQQDLKTSGFSQETITQLLSSHKDASHLKRISVSHQQSVLLLHQAGKHYSNHSSNVFGLSWNHFLAHEKAAITYLDYQANIEGFPAARRALESGNLSAAMDNMLPIYRTNGALHYNTRTLGFLQATLYSKESFHTLIQHPIQTEMQLSSHATLGSIFGPNLKDKSAMMVHGQQIKPLHHVAWTPKNPQERNPFSAPNPGKPSRTS